MKLIFLWYVIEVICAFICTYFVFTFIVSNITINPEFEQTPNGISIYIVSNGAHLDIVVPVKNKQEDWTTFINPSDIHTPKTQKKWISFGWGDKGFYLETPAWKDLKLSVALKAISGLNKTAMHVSFLENIVEGKRCKKIMISEVQYKLLSYEIKNQFSEKKPIKIPHAFYGENDSFYNAKGKYSLFNTCNTWANSVLKKSKIKACLWTPFAFTILSKH